MSRRIGVLSGTFDPVHNGHIQFALTTQKMCGLDEVVFLVEKNPRRKKKAVPYVYRKDMVELAVAAHVGLRLLELPEEQFSAEETLPSLKKRLGTHECWLLVGSDVFYHLPEWPNIGLLADTARFAIGQRSRKPQTDVDEAIQEMKVRGIVVRHKVISTDLPDLSSSQVRSLIEGGGVPHNVPPPVKNYITENGLYSKTGSASS